MTGKRRWPCLQKGQAHPPPFGRRVTLALISKGEIRFRHGYSGLRTTFLCSSDLKWPLPALIHPMYLASSGGATPQRCRLSYLLKTHCEKHCCYIHCTQTISCVGFNSTFLSGADTLSFPMHRYAMTFIFALHDTRCMSLDASNHKQLVVAPTHSNARAWRRVKRDDTSFDLSFNLQLFKTNRRKECGTNQ